MGTVKFLPSDLIASDLLEANSNITFESLRFPSEIQSNFVSTYNLQLYVAYIFFIMSLIWTSFAILYGMLGLAFGQFSSFNSLFTSSASTCLLIACAILTAMQAQGAGIINVYGTGDGFSRNMGVKADCGNGLLSLAWAAFGLSFFSTGIWIVAGFVSAAYRNP
jgi:hypothetical protein